MTPTDPSTWLPGQVVLHRSGQIRTLLRRSFDEEGWSLLPHGFLSDTSGDWIALTPAHVALLFNLAGAG